MNPWEPLECETHEYRNPLGETVRWRTLIGTVGRMMPPIQITSIPVPSGHGSRFRAAAHTERPVAFQVATPGPLDGRDELRRWAAVLDPAKGEGTVTVVQGEWAGRRLRCVYEAGLDELEENHRSWNPAALVFRAAWPYWEDASESEKAVTQDDTTHTWFPFLPLVLGASDAFAVFTVTNAGDVTTWPIVTVTGPALEVTASNETTGLSWHVTGSIADGSTLVVDTRPGFKTVTVDGVNAFNRLTDTSSLWGLQPGANRVEIAGAATSSATAIRFTWRQAWLAA